MAENQSWDESAGEKYEPSEFTQGKIVKRSGTAGFDPMVIDDGTLVGSSSSSLKSII